MACFLQQQLPVSSKQVEIKTLNLVCLYRPLKENSNQNQFIFLGWISELILRGYNVLVSPKSHLNGWIKHNKTTANKKTHELLICKSLEIILAFYCFPINKMQEIVLSASPLQLPFVYHIKCPFFQAFQSAPADRLCKRVLQFSIWNRTDPNSVQSNAKCLHVLLLLQGVSSQRRQCTELCYELAVWKHPGSLGKMVNQ